jgi:tyrosyl-tRNA synthetase
MASFPFFKELQERGLVKQVTHEKLATLLDQDTLTVYVGIDPTADSLHVGHLLAVLTLKRMQLAGHRPIALIGGATGMIGDPSGKSEERQLLTKEKIQENAAGIEKTLKKFLSFDGPKSAKVVNNIEWFEAMSYIDFLRDAGKHFTVNHMMAKESVKARLEDREQGISYTEFSYMLLQAYDFYHLLQKENCTLQIGGSDQWGNITAGGELIRRMYAAQGKEAPEVYGFTHPLVTKSDGTKFGKTEGGNVWLSAERTSPYDFYQFFIRTPDTDVMKLLKYFTFLSLEEINALEKEMKERPEQRAAQRALAREITQLVHGEDELHRVERATDALFTGEIQDLDAKSLKEVFAEAPSTLKSIDDLKKEIPLLDLLVETYLCPSKGAARRDLQAGSIYLNQERVTDLNLCVSPAHLLANSFILLRRGKKHFHLVQVES